MESTEFNEKITSSVEHLAKELAAIRTGRANTSLIENIKVEYYGNATPLNQLANLSVTSPKSLLVEPFDKNGVKEVEKALTQSDLNLSVAAEGTQLRVNLPDLTAERRQELVKVLGQKVEATRVSIKRHREEYLRSLKEQKDQGGISEDDMERMQKEAQEQVDQANQQIEEKSEQKKKELESV